MVFIGALFGMFISIMLLLFIGICIFAVLEEIKKDYPWLYKHRLEVTIGILITLLIIISLITLFIS